MSRGVKTIYGTFFSLRPPVAMVTKKLATILEQIKNILCAHSSHLYNKQVDNYFTIMSRMHNTTQLQHIFQYFH